MFAYNHPTDKNYRKQFYSTLIDHVYTNNTTKEIKSFILLHDLTDHMPTIVSTNLKKLN